MALTLARGHTAREQRARAPSRLLGAQGCALILCGRDTACWPDLPLPSFMTSPGPRAPRRVHTSPLGAPQLWPGELVPGHPGESLVQTRESEACLSALEKYGPHNFAKCKGLYPPDLQQKGADMRNLHRDAGRDPRTGAWPPAASAQGSASWGESGPFAPFLRTGGQRLFTWLCSTLPLLS